MSFIIDINTDELKNAVTIARRANEQLTEAMNLLNQIVVHNDWECSERDQMNENTVRNKADINNIQNNAEVFYNNICYASDRFSALEQEIYDSFGLVEGPLGTFLSLVPQNSGLNSGGSFSEMVNGTMNNVASTLSDTNGGVASALKDTIDIISFKDIATGLTK